VLDKIQKLLFYCIIILFYSIRAESHGFLGPDRIITILYYLPYTLNFVHHTHTKIMLLLQFSVVKILLHHMGSLAVFFSGFVGHTQLCVLRPLSPIGEVYYLSGKET